MLRAIGLPNSQLPVSLHLLLHMWRIAATYEEYTYGLLSSVHKLRGCEINASYDFITFY